MLSSLSPLATASYMNVLAICVNSRSAPAQLAPVSTRAADLREQNLSRAAGRSRRATAARHRGRSPAASRPSLLLWSRHFPRVRQPVHHVP